MAQAQAATNEAQRPSDPRSAQIREALEKILATDPFLSSKRRSSLLRYLVEEAISGRAEGVKEYTIGLEVFEKEPTYDPRLDPIVRVEIGRLRQKLAKYYDADGVQDVLKFQLPKGSYQIQFVHPEAPSRRQSNSRLLLVVVAAAICVAIGFAAWTRSGKLGTSERTLYQSGFEAPYSLGQLTGQGGWITGPIAVESHITVQSGIVFTGAQAVQIAAAGAMNMTRALHIVGFDAKTSAAKTVAMSVDAELSNNGTPSTWELIDTFGRGEPFNFLAFLAVKPSGELFLRQREGITHNTGIFVTRGVWNHFELDFDFGDNSLTAYFNGRKVVSKLPFESATNGTLWKAGFEIGFGPVGTDTAYFDNFAVSVR